MYQISKIKLLKSLESVLTLILNFIKKNCKKKHPTLTICNMTRSDTQMYTMHLLIVIYPCVNNCDIFNPHYGIKTILVFIKNFDRTGAIFCRGKA